MTFSIASYYRLGGRDDLARPLTDKVIEHYRAELAQLERDGHDDEKRAALLGALAWTYLESGDPARAEPVGAEALALDRKSGCPRKAVSSCTRGSTPGAQERGAPSSSRTRKPIGCSLRMGRTPSRAPPL